MAFYSMFRGYRRIQVVAVVCAVLVAALLSAEPAQASTSVYQPPSDVDHVRAVIKKGDKFIETIWDVAPEYTAKVLHAQLAAQGVRGLIDPATEAANILSEPVDCSIGGAYAWGRWCGVNRVHWAGTHPVVYFIDHSGDNWPVYSAVSVWNQSYAIDSGYRWYTNGCPGSNCVHVYSGPYGPGFTDKSQVAWNASLELIASDMWVQLNDYYSHTPAGYQKTSCHELGHIHALDHNVWDNSCLWYQSTELDSMRYPNSGDFAMLESIYWG